MPSLRRTCRFCQTDVVITFTSINPLAGQALSGGLILCADCVDRLKPEPHPRWDGILIQDGIEFAKTANVWATRPELNPESPFYDSHAEKRRLPV